MTRWLAVVLVGVPLVIFPEDAAAYRTVADTPEVSSTERVRWSTSAVPYAVHSSPPLGVTLADYERAVRLGFARWTEVACSEFEALHQGLTEGRASPDDGQVTVEVVRGEWGARGFTSDAAAVTDATYVRGEDGTWRIADADILLNDDDFEWEADGAPPGGDLRDLQSVITHEAGHCAGLAHPCEPGGVDGAPDCDASDEFADVTMYPIYRGAEQRTLDVDDEDGLCFLYPAGPCDDRSCPAGMMCIPDGCVAVCGEQVCALGEVCTASGCTDPDCTDCSDESREPCTADADCAAQELCDRGVCVADLGETGDPCVDPAECRSGLCSESGYCTKPCGSGLACPEGLTCEDSGGSSSACAADSGVFEADCRRASDCLSEVCLEGAAEHPICSRACGEGIPTCPAGYVCGEVSGRSVCRPPPAGGGCAAAPGRPRSGLLTLLTFLGFVMMRSRAAGGLR